MRALYALAVVLCIGLAFAFTSKDAGSQAAVPETDLLLIACNHANAAADQAGVVMTRCRKTVIEQVGNRARVDIQVKIDPYGLFNVRVWLFQTGWSSQGFSAVPVTR